MNCESCGHDFIMVTTGRLTDTKFERIELDRE